jgi:hypothetical protein
VRVFFGTSLVISGWSGLPRADLCVAIRKEVWHSLRVLTAQRHVMKHFIQFEAQVMPVIRPDYLRAMNGFWTPDASLRIV